MINKSSWYISIMIMSIILMPGIIHGADSDYVITIPSLSLIGSVCEIADTLIVAKHGGLHGISLESKQVVWSHDFIDNSNPVIDSAGLVQLRAKVQIDSKNETRCLHITPAGVISDTTAIETNDSTTDRKLDDEGHISLTGYSQGYITGWYTPEPPAIGYAGMCIDGKSAIDLYGIEQWNTGLNGPFTSVVDNNGTVYFHTGSVLKAYSNDGELLWTDSAHLRDSGALYVGDLVIGSDGRLYVGTRNNRVYCYSTSANPDSAGMVLQVYEGDDGLWNELYDAQMIITESGNLCFISQDLDNVYIEVFSVPAIGYQADAYWPCFGHDNRRSFTTIAPTFYTITGQVLSNDTPLSEISLFITGTESFWVTDETGSFSMELPSGSYSFTIFGEDEVYPLTVEGSDISGIQYTVTSPIQFLWKSYLTDKNNYHGIIPNNIAVAHDGNIIAGVGYIPIGHSRPGTIFTIQPDGMIAWERSTGTVYTAPVITQDNSSITYIYNDFLSLALSSVYHDTWYGMDEWYSCSFDIAKPPAVDTNGILYYVTADSVIIGRNQSDEVVWQSEASVIGEPVIDQYGIMYVASDSSIYAFNTDGTVRWHYDAGNAVGAISLGNGCVYAGCEDYTIISLWSDGSIKRIFYPGIRPSCSPAVDSDGTLYVGGKNGSLFALNDNGTVKWQVALDSAIAETPIIADDDMIYVTSKKTIYAIHSDGTLYWEYTFLQEIPDHSEKAYLTLDDNGILYSISSKSNALYAFQTDSSGLKTDAPWPCYRGNNQRTGCLPADFVVASEEQEPVAFDLLANYPNPFNPTTTISFAIPENGRVKLAVYSMSGQKVATLVDDMLDAGAHNVVFDGAGFASGLYVYRLEAGNVAQTGKMLLMK